MLSDFRFDILDAYYIPHHTFLSKHLTGLDFLPRYMVHFGRDFV